jgi:hypothetical protein
MMTFPRHYNFLKRLTGRSISYQLRGYGKHKHLEEVKVDMDELLPWIKFMEYGKLVFYILLMVGIVALYILYVVLSIIY